jgi:sterol desaturase/sphingolipid hydroxylase (fatty acid hydroxylase superfamily)
MRIIILLLDRFLPEQYSRMRMAIQLILATIVSVGLVLIGLNLYFKYIVGFSISITQVLTFGIIYTVTALLYNILYFSNHYLQMENTVKINAEKQHHEVLEMEMIGIPE